MSENVMEFVKPTFFEIFKKVLNELSWREVSDFSAIEKPEHKRVLNLINATNSEVLSSYPWDFLNEKEDITLAEGKRVIKEGFSGKVISIYEGNRKYKYYPPSYDFSKLPQVSSIYSVSGDKIITKETLRKRTLSVLYISNMFALSKTGAKKTTMNLSDDTSVIPMPYLEPILVYGTLIKVKANPSFAKFGFWRTMFYNTISALRSEGSHSIDDTPRISF